MTEETPPTIDERDADALPRLDKAALMGAAEIPSGPILFEVAGGLVEVRALTRHEALDVGTEEDIPERDVLMLNLGLVDPKMSMQDVREWQKRPGQAGVIEDVSQAIGQLSGMAERDRVIYARFRGVDFS